MCHVLNVSKSGFYKKGNTTESLRAMKNRLLRGRITEIYTAHNGMIGSPMITAELRSEKEFAKVSKNRVARHMKNMNLKCKTTKKFIVTTDSKHNRPVAPNIVNRDFSVHAPNRVWVGDITYIKVGNKWCYLSVFIDLYSRIVVGWDLSTSLESSSTITAFNKSLLRRDPEQGLVVHSDRGIQYASSTFQSLLSEKGFVQSMSRKGNCWDNAVAESFFKTLKVQFIYHNKFHNLQEVETGLFKYIEIYYNRIRRHSSNGYISPAKFEETGEYFNLVA